MIEWNRIWKEIQNDRAGQYSSGQILEHWKQAIPDGACLRKGWPHKNDKPHFKHLGYRKQSKVGHETAGEKGLEIKLLGENGKGKIHYIEKGSETLRLQVCFHNMGLGTAQNVSQKIIDCFGVINVGNENYPTAIEVKVDNEGPWYAVIENLIQVQMLHQNLENLQRYFGDPPLSFGIFRQSWGIVLAPETYFANARRKNEKSFNRVFDLLECIRGDVRVTLVSCDPEAARLSYVGGFWPSKA